MLRRVRTTAALAALAVTLIGQAEQVWAATCAPEMAMTGSAADMTSMAGMDMEMPMPASGDSDHRDEAPPPAECPLAVITSCHFGFMPALGEHNNLASPIEAQPAAVVLLSLKPDGFLGTPFHPPKA